MAARIRAPAITPDARRAGKKAAAPSPSATAAAPPRRNASRKRAPHPGDLASFGFGPAAAAAPKASSSSSSSSLAARSASESDADAAALLLRRRYARFRSSPDRFPSYDRLRFVSLPPSFVPPSLRHHPLRRWPSLVYRSLAELVRDLGPDESRVIKARLVLEHRKRPGTVVARLLGWDASDGSSSSSSGHDDPFEESKLELIRLTGRTLEENEDPTNGYDELVGFADAQCELEEACDALLARAGDEAADEGARRHARNFRKAVDAALNMLALDVGAEPLPAREEFGGGGGGADARAYLTPTPTAAAAATAGKGAFSAERPRADAKEAAEKEGPAKKSARTPVASEPAKEKALAAATGAGEDKENGRENGAAARVPKGRKNEGLKPRGGSAVGRRGLSPQESPKRPRAKPKPRTDDGSGVVRAGLRSNPRDGPAKPASRSQSEAPAFDKATDTRDAGARDEPEMEVAPWKDVWNAMKKAGWTWRGGSGLMTDYYYVRPGRRIESGRDGIDYFTRVEDVQAYARLACGWGSSSSRDAVMAAIEEDAALSKGESVPALAEELDPRAPWSDAWDLMRRSGWTWRAGTGLMTDYYYLKPDGKVKGGFEGRDYFVKKEDLQRFAVRGYGWRGPDEVSARGGDGIGRDGSDGAGGGRTTRKRRSTSLEPRLSVEEAGRTARGRRSTSLERPTKAAAEERATKPRKIESVKNAVRKKRAEAGLTPTKPKSTGAVGRGGAPPSFFQNTPSRGGSHAMAAKDVTKPKSTGAVGRGGGAPSFFQSTPFHENGRAAATADGVPPLMQKIDPNESWSDAWHKMLDSGWTWKVGTGLMTDYYYIKPGRKVKGGVEGKDYFVSVEGAKEFAARNYGWRGATTTDGASPGGKRRRKSLERDGKGTAASTLNKRQRVVEKVRQHKEKARTPKVAAPAPMDKKALWQALQRDGYRVVRAGKFNNLHDWYYVPPNVYPGHAGFKVGVDYFLSEDDAIDHARRSGWTPSTSRKASTAAEAGWNTPAGCRTKPLDPAAPLLSSPESHHSSRSGQDYYEWTNLWPVLQKTGWKCVKAGRYNPLHDWYYVRPDRDPGDPACMLGRHYFHGRDDVVAFVLRLDREGGGSGTRGGGKGKSRRCMGAMLEAFEEEASKMG